MVGDMLAHVEREIATKLRGAWAGRWIVILALDTIATMPRLVGRVERVSPTGATATLEVPDGGRVDVPCRLVLSVRRPHFHEPSDVDVRRMDRLPSRDLAPMNGQLPLFDRERNP